MKTFTKCFGNYNEKGYLTATGWKREENLCNSMMAIDTTFKKDVAKKSK